MAGDYCNVAERDCRNPAGYRVGGSVGGAAADNPDPPRTIGYCIDCGATCCGACGKTRTLVILPPRGKVRGRVCDPCWSAEKERKKKGARQMPSPRQREQ